jgi:hypothetical protein
MNYKLILMQFARDKLDSEDVLKEKLKDTQSPKEGERVLDTLMALRRCEGYGLT